MARPVFGIYGSGGCARGIMPLARTAIAKLGIALDRLAFVDDNPTAPQINGHRVLTRSEFLEIPASEHFIAIAISNSVVRERLARATKVEKIRPWTIVAENVVVMDDVHIGEGAIVSPFATITSNIRIGHQFHANLYSYVEHDCVVGDYVTLAPGAKINGNVVVEDHAYIGSGAVIKQGRPGAPLVIGKGAVVGMGAVVTKSVAPGDVVVGNPARPHVRSRQ